MNPANDTRPPPRTKRSPERMLLTVALSLVSAFVLAMVIPMFRPGFFGSCFEGSCGFMAVFIFTPGVSLILAPVWWLLLRWAGPMSFMILWFLLMLTAGFVMFSRLEWAVGLVALAGLMVWQWKRHRQQGLSVRELFVRSARKP